MELSGSTELSGTFNGVVESQFWSVPRPWLEIKAWTWAGFEVESVTSKVWDSEIDEFVDDANADKDNTDDEVIELAKEEDSVVLSVRADEDDEISELTSAGDARVDSVRVNEDMVDDEKAEDAVWDRASKTRTEELLFFGEDEGGGASFPDSMETEGERLEKRSGEDEYWPIGDDFKKICRVSDWSYYY